jgi:hypothetical protein
MAVNPYRFGGADERDSYVKQGIGEGARTGNV